MTGNTRVVPAAVDHPRRLLDVVRGWILSLVRPTVALPARLVALVARWRTPGHHRLPGRSRLNNEHTSPSRRAPAVSLRLASPDTPISAAAHPGREQGALKTPRFSTVRVGADWNPRAYLTAFRALQDPAGSKLFDLGAVRLLCAGVFEALANAWNAPGSSVPRLAILLSFERWVMLRELAWVALQPLRDRGVRVELFYCEQAGYLEAWFAHGQVVHNVPPCVATLSARWQPSPSWPVVIDMLSQLARAHSTAAELPVLLVDIAGIALSCGGAEKAAHLASEALYYMRETPSSTRAKALRTLGAARLGQGQTEPGLTLLDQAIEMATTVQASAIAATALCQSGLFALNHGDYVGAERRFREAIEILSPPPRRPHLLALAQHNLAIALLFQGRSDAAEHARAALALRGDRESHLAEEDRVLLQLCEVRADAN